MQETKLLNIDETSAYLGIKKPTLYSWVFQKKIPYIKVGRMIRFNVNELLLWLEEKSVKAK